MAEKVQETGGYFFMIMIIVWICGTLSMFLVTSHFYHYYKNEISSNSLTTTSSTKTKKSAIHKPISILTIIMICTMSTGPIWGVFSQIHNLVSPNIIHFACSSTGLKIYGNMYFIAKGCMYLIFIMRLHQIYGSSAFGYKPLILKIMGSTIFCTTLFLCILNIAVVKPAYYTVELFGVTYHNCNSVYPDYFAMLYGPHEVIVTIITLIMFIRPLRKLLKTVREHGGKGAEKRTFGFKFVAIKACFYISYYQYTFLNRL